MHNSGVFFDSYDRQGLARPSRMYSACTIAALISSEAPVPSGGMLVPGGGGSLAREAVHLDVEGTCPAKNEPPRRCMMARSEAKR
jgi:hypothetical protein